MAIVSHPSIRAWFSVVVAAALVPGPAMAHASRQTSQLVAWVRAADWDQVFEPVPTMALDLDAADVPALASLLESGTEPQQTITAHVLAYAGGDAAIAALRASRKPIAASMLPLALMQRGTAADSADLARALEGRDDAGASTNPELSALGLGLLRVADAVPALEHAAQGTTGPAFEARQALRWIRQGHWRIDALPTASDEDRLIAAVFANGVPGVDEGTTLLDDEDRGGTWILDGDAWRYRAGGRATDVPHLGFTARFNPGRTRAILSSSLVCGALCGVGHDYLFTREASGWKLRGILNTWIS